MPIPALWMDTRRRSTGSLPPTKPLPCQAYNFLFMKRLRILSLSLVLFCGADAKVAWCFNWITHHQSLPIPARQWPPTQGWGMKFGGLPFHEHVFSPRRPDGAQLAALGDADLHRLEAIFDKDPSLTQLSMFMLMSCAMRLDPGGIYRTVREHSPSGP